MSCSSRTARPKRTWVKWLCILVSVSAFLPTNSFSQTSLEDVHITPRPPTTPSPQPNAAPHAASATAPDIRKNVDLVLVPVSVTDGLERLVTGLAPDNFQIFEGKQRQEIKHFSSEDTPISLGIIVDVSGSMSDKIDRVREAVTKFCDTANLLDEFFLITFSDQPHLVLDFTNTPEDIERELLFAMPKHRTALLDAIYMGIEKMRDAQYSKKALLVVSDGGDNHSRYTERDLKSVVKESDVMIYAIGVFDRYVPTEEEKRGPELLSDVTEITGGRAFILDNPVQMPAIAHKIGTELRTQYVLGYRPENAPHDGKWHKIKVKLALPHGLILRVRARTGYYGRNQ